MDSVEELLAKGVIRPTKCSSGEFMNRLFLVPKPDGTFRPILNVKKFNDSVKKEHFKMESIKDAMMLVTPNCYMMTLDLKDAFQAVPITPGQYKYFRFRVAGQHYEFVRMCFGLTTAPWTFTKVMKVLILYLCITDCLIVHFQLNYTAIQLNCTLYNSIVSLYNSIIH